MSGDPLRQIALQMDDDGYRGGELVRIWANAVDELQRFAELTVEVWLEMTDGVYPAVGDEWGHMCWQLAKQSGRIEIDEADIEWEGISE